MYDWVWLSFDVILNKIALTVHKDAFQRKNNVIRCFYFFFYLQISSLMGYVLFNFFEKNAYKQF